jgi:hypothetical protein
MLAVSDVIRNRRYAELYARVLELGTPTVEEIAAGVDSSTTTVYEDIDHLLDVGLLARVTETQPHRYEARGVEMTVETGERARVSPAFLVALARADTNENIRLYLDRHGVAGLAAALEHARDYARGQTNARLVARELDVPVLEAETILQELREVVLDVEDIDSLDADALDTMVERQAE